MSLLARAFRYGLAGAVVAVVYLSLTLALSRGAGLPFQVALAIGFAAGLATHFTLQRLFVWVHHDEFALPLRHQAGRYLVIAMSQYGITALATATLPDAFDTSPEVVYVITTAVLTVFAFLLFRSRVFHAASPPGEAAAQPALDDRRASGNAASDHGPHRGQRHRL
jgi:putative flippase GtrA